MVTACMTWRAMCGNFSRMNGEIVFVDIQVLPLEKGKNTTLALLFVDVTSQVQARKRIEDANSKLEDTLRELKIASDSKENFLSIMSHEIRRLRRHARTEITAHTITTHRSY